MSHSFMVGSDDVCRLGYLMLFNRDKNPPVQPTGAGRMTVEERRAKLYDAYAQCKRHRTFPQVYFQI